MLSKQRNIPKKPTRKRPKEPTTRVARKAVRRRNQTRRATKAWRQRNRPLLAEMERARIRRSRAPEWDLELGPEEAAVARIHDEADTLYKEYEQKYQAARQRLVEQGWSTSEIEERLPAFTEVIEQRLDILELAERAIVAKASARKVAIEKVVRERIAQDDAYMERQPLRYVPPAHLHPDFNPRPVCRLCQRSDTLGQNALHWLCRACYEDRIGPGEVEAQIRDAIESDARELAGGLGNLVGKTRRKKEEPSTVGADAVLRPAGGWSTVRDRDGNVVEDEGGDGISRRR